VGVSPAVGQVIDPCAWLAWLASEALP
jgi:hypothetical protein